ncbi:MAG TPA: glycosyltransferase family 2 protein [Rhizomicrobium sp.]|nr:glycosyltransferase family 2 protein [Rhizomicrobium sp.]
MLYDAVVPAVDAVVISALVGMTVVGVGFLGLPALYLIEKLTGSRDGREARAEAVADQALPDVLVQLPVYNEPGVVVGLLDSVAALDWPKDKLHIQLLDDSSDTETVAIANARIAQLRCQGFRVDHVLRPHREGFKAEALAAGLAVSDAPFVAVLDADFRPPADWLSAVVPRLMESPQAGFIQSRCEFTNADTNWLTRAQGLLLDAHFIMEQAVRARWDMLIQFNGTAAVWRRAAIDAAGGWSGDFLSEDLDLTIRAALAGWRGIFAAEPVVRGLVPHRVEHWRVQQQRWAMGFAQVARKLMTLIWTSDWSWAAKISVAFLILYQAAFPIAAVGTIALLIDLALRGRDLALVLPFFGFVVALGITVAVVSTLPPYLQLRRGGIGRYLLTLMTLPPLVFCLAFSNAEPMFAAFLGRADIFHRTPKEEASC